MLQGARMSAHEAGMAPAEPAPNAVRAPQSSPQTIPLHLDIEQSASGRLQTCNKGLHACILLLTAANARARRRRRQTCNGACTPAPWDRTARLWCSTPAQAAAAVPPGRMTPAGSRFRRQRYSPSSGSALDPWGPACPRARSPSATGTRRAALPRPCPACAQTRADC